MYIDKWSIGRRKKLDVCQNYHLNNIFIDNWSRKKIGLDYEKIKSMDLLDKKRIRYGPFFILFFWEGE